MLPAIATDTTLKAFGSILDAVKEMSKEKQIQMTDRVRIREQARLAIKIVEENATTIRYKLNSEHELKMEAMSMVRALLSDPANLNETTLVFCKEMFLPIINKDSTEVINHMIQASKTLLLN